MREVTLVASLHAPPTPAELAGLQDLARCLEVRADLAGDLDPDWLRRHYRGQLLYSLRTRAEGGAFESPNGARATRLRAAARHYDLVELEADRDLSPDLLAHIPPAQRVVSWQGTAAAGLPELRARLARVASVEAHLYRLAPAAARSEDALAPLRLLHELRRHDVCAYATGPAGTWSRLLAPRLGAPIVIGRAGAGADSGEPTLAQLVADYGLPALGVEAELFGIVGHTAATSLSPRLHNAAYRALGLPALYLPFPTGTFEEFWREVAGGLERLGWPLGGLTVTSPHKEAALAVAEAASPVARQAGAANTLLRRPGGWHADTADADGVLQALARRRVEVAGRRVAVVGCGGAGRAAAAGLQGAGAKVTLVNRGTERGLFAARLLALPFVRLADFSPDGYSLVVHATPVADAAPFSVEGLSKEAVVLDLVYRTAPTALVAASSARGRVAIDGREVLVVEALRQFQLMTGRRMPAGPARRLVGALEDGR